MNSKKYILKIGDNSNLLCIPAEDLTIELENVEIRIVQKSGYGHLKLLENGEIHYIPSIANKTNG